MEEVGGTPKGTREDGFTPSREYRGTKIRRQHGYSANLEANLEHS